METKEFKNKLIEILESKKKRSKENNTIKIKDENNEFTFQIFNFYEKYNKNFWIKFNNQNNILNSQLIYKYINYFINFFVKTYKNITFLELQILDVYDQTYPYICDISIKYENNKIIFELIRTYCKNKLKYEYNINEEEIDYNKIDLDNITKLKLEEYNYYEINMMFCYK